MTLHDTGSRRPATGLSSELFNRGSEKLYRTALRQHHLSEGFSVLVEDIAALERDGCQLMQPLMQNIAPELSATAYLERHRHDLSLGQSTAPVIRNVLHLALAVIYGQTSTTA